MKLLRANIFGFGKWVDVELEFPREGPIIIFGENESGKSTFHQFILFMLFGMPPKQRKFYQPKTSSKLGGQLVIEDPELGLFTIERVDDRNNGQATCFSDAGETYDEAWLKERLHGMDQKTFEDIFSFSALDLNAIKDMREEELGDVLLSIGLTGSSSIYRIEKQLDARLGELFKPHGKNPEINKQLQLLQQQAEKLAEIQMEEATYQSKTTESELLLTSLNDLKQQKQRLEEENNWITKQLTALPALKEHQYLSVKYGDFQEMHEFPTNGVERLEKIKDVLRPLESEYAVLKSNLESYQSSLAEITKLQLPREYLQELTEKLQEKVVHSKLTDRISELQSRMEIVKQKIVMELSDLQINLKEEELTELSLPYYIEETWKQLKEDRERLTQEKVTLETEKRTFTEEKNYFEQELTRKESTLLPEHELSKLRQKLRKGKEHEQLERLYEATTSQQKILEEEKTQKMKRANLFFATGVILSLIAIGFAFATDQNLLYGIGVVVFILSMGQSYFMKQSVKEMEKLIQLPPDLHHAEKLSEAEINVLEQQLMKEEEKQNDIKQLQSDLQKLTIRLLQLEEKERNYLEKNQRHNQQLEEQYNLYPFLENINSSYWPDYYHRLKGLLTMYQEYEQFTGEVMETQEKQQQIEIGIIDFLHTYNRESIDTIEEAFTWIEDQLAKEEQLNQRKLHVEELIQEVEAKLGDMTKRISVHEKEREDLFQLANVNSEEEFYQRSEYLQEKENLETALDTNRKQLDTIFPNNTWVDAIDDSEFDLENRRQHIEAEQRVVRDQMESTRAKLAEVNAELKRLEGSDVYSEHMHQFEMEKEKLHQLAKEWAIIKIEKEILAETKQRYKEKYLSKVLEETTSFLRTITSGRYTAVYSPVDKEPFQVMAADGIRYMVTELSQGTMNQLYVSLRLAISKVMTGKHHVPFIVDDAFVHFDEVRVKRMIEVLDGMASNQQVILFTCKRDVVESCKELNLSIINLRNELPIS